MPRNITITFDDGSTHVYQGAPDSITPDAVQARAQQEFGKTVVHMDGGRDPKMEVVKETGRVLDKGLRGGVTALPGLIGDASVQAAKNDHVLTGLGVYGLPTRAAKALIPGFKERLDEMQFGDVTKTIQTVGGLLPEVSKPQTEPGKAIGNVLEATVGAVLGGGAGSVGQKAAIGAAGGAGGEAAARTLGDNFLTRFLGSLAGGGLTGIFQNLRSNPDKLVRQATEHVTDIDWQKAKAIEGVLEASNIPHTKSQLLGPRSTLDDVVAAASSNPSVRPKLITATEGAPKAAETALNVWTNKNLPPPGPNSRSEVLGDVQEAAELALRTVKNKSNQAFTKAMPPKHIEYDQGRTRTLYNSLQKLADDPRFGKTTDAGKAILKLAEDLVEGRKVDTSKVNPEILKWAQAEAKANGIPFDASNLPGAKATTSFVTNAHKINNLNKELKLLATREDYKGLPIDDVRRIFNQATPEFNVARAAKQKVMEQEYNPAAKGLTGQIAQMGGGTKPDKLTAKDTALGMVFNATQPQATAIKELGKTMGGDQVGELLREHIHRTMQQVLKQEEKSPRSFVQALYESPAQKENIDAALEVTARHYQMNPDAIKVGFRRMMESFDTFKDFKLAGGVSPGATTGEASQNLVSKVIRPSTTFGRRFDQSATTKTFEKISELVTSKNGLAKLQAIAKAKDPETLRQLVLSVGISTAQAKDMPGE